MIILINIYNQSISENLQDKKKELADSFFMRFSHVLFFELFAREFVSRKGRKYNCVELVT